MAIMISMFWQPNVSDTVQKLVANQLEFRKVARETGLTCDVVQIIPGGGGVQGETGIVIELDNDGYVEFLDGEPDPRWAKYQEAYKASDSKPVRTSTMLEIPGTEVANADLPKGFVQVSLIDVLPGKVQEAVADLTKSTQIMGRLGIKTRAMQAFLADPWPRLAFMQFYESAADWNAKSGALFADSEWATHFGRSHENRKIVRQSAYQFMP